MLFNQTNILLILTEKVSYILHYHLFHIKPNMYFKAMLENVKL